MFSQIRSLPIEKKIGQMFIIGIPGIEIDENTESLLSEIAPGGICLFSRNIREAFQTRGLLDDLREILEIEPILSIDQEGGLVDRLRRLGSPMPSASSINSRAAVESLADLTAEFLRILGFNMNFAPVVDVIDETRLQFSNGLYSRAFGKNEQEVFSLANAYLRKLQNGGCFGCLKHFPGLGASELDSHEKLPQVNISREEFYSKDIFPYREFFESGEIYAVMVAHASFPELGLQEKDADGKYLPTSLSRNFVTKLLREDLGFENLVLTDDLEMGAIEKNYGIGEACKMAIKAGVDILCICADSEKMRTGFKAVLEAVKNGEISQERIDESLKRVALVKSLLSAPLPFDAERIRTLSAQISKLNKKVKYSYGG